MALASPARHDSGVRIVGILAYLKRYQGTKAPTGSQLPQRALENLPLIAGGRSASNQAACREMIVGFSDQNTEL